MKKLLIAGYESSTDNYRAAFARLGIQAVSLGDPSQIPLPDSSASNRESLIPHSCHGLVLPGGGDMEPSLFGQTNTGSRNIDEPLDRLQLWLLDQFLHMGKPVLGICKGLQILNVYFGGTLIQDLPEDSLRLHAYDGRDNIHPTQAALGTFPEQLYGPNPVTNSAHHQGIGSVGDELLVAQYSFDFVVEALYHKTLPVLGVQWHPERMRFSHATPELADGSLLLRYFSTLL